MREEVIAPVSYMVHLMQKIPLNAENAI